MKEQKQKIRLSCSIPSGEPAYLPDYGSLYTWLLSKTYDLLSFTYPKVGKLKLFKKSLK